MRRRARSVLVHAGPGSRAAGDGQSDPSVDVIASEDGLQLGGDGVGGGDDGGQVDAWVDRGGERDD